MGETLRILRSLCENGDDVDIDTPFHGTPQEHWLFYSQKCHLYVLKWHERDPELTPVRGFYFCPVWNQDRQHWWLQKPDGTIFDPTVTQFPSAGLGTYQPFEDLELNCDQCGKSVPKELLGHYHHNYTLCSNRCYGRMVGF